MIGMNYCRIVCLHTDPHHTPTQALLPLNCYLAVMSEGPLKAGWQDGDTSEKAVVTWVAELRKKLTMTEEIVGEKEAAAKGAMKRQYDRKATPISHSPGKMVLLRAPHLQDKLQDTWHGPYEFTKQISPVTYVVAVPKSRTRK